MRASDTSCSLCGRGLKLPALPRSLEVQGQRGPTLIIDGPDAVTGERKTTVDEPSGSAEMQFSRDQVNLTVRGGGAGQPSEGQARKLLQRTISSSGTPCHIEYDPERDRRGEDGTVKLQDGDNLQLQLVTAPLASEFWHSAKRGSAHTQVDLPSAADWIRDAIVKKAQRTPERDRAGIVLGIDAQKAPLLGDQRITSAYEDAYGDPHVTEGFASVWVIGPKKSLCTRIGTGRP